MISKARIFRYKKERISRILISYFEVFIFYKNKSVTKYS